MQSSIQVLYCSLIWETQGGHQGQRNKSRKGGSVYSDRKENLLLPRGRRASLSVFGQHWPPPVRVQQKSQKQKWVQKEVQTGATYGIIQKINGSVKSYQQSTKRYVWYMKLLF